MTDKTAIQHQRMRRRDLLALIGVASGAATMFQSMTALGFVAESPYKGPIRLDGDPKSASVLILGAGLAGMVVAYELRKAGYKLQILEYNDRAGGRSWTIRGGDAYTELGGFTQKCAFDRGLYFNPGPWRIPYHHRAILDYCKRLGVALEPFVQVNHNAYVHSENALDGRPQRFRFVQADFNGAIAELLAKAANSPAKPPAMPERIEAVLQLRELGRRITTISSGEPRGSSRRSQCHRIIII